MSQKGEHTWDLIIQYHRCPKCDKIVESREDYEYRLGKYQKDVMCPRCKYSFTITKLIRSRPAPLFGEPQPVEWDWR